MNRAKCKLAHALAIAVDDAGNSYVADTGNAGIHKFDARGGYLDSWGAKGTAPGQFGGLGGVAVTAAGALYTSEFGNARVQVFTQPP